MRRRRRRRIEGGGEEKVGEEGEECLWTPPSLLVTYGKLRELIKDLDNLANNKKKRL
jgi:hypothetical protein